MTLEKSRVGSPSSLRCVGVVASTNGVVVTVSDINFGEGLEP
jgi:hypothetical protein